MLNVHGSLLPRWRGASPIVYAIANGDSETGVTIMRIKPHKFDTGDILLQEKVTIDQTMEMPVLYKKLGQLGAECLVKSLKNVDKYVATSRPQPENGVTYGKTATFILLVEKKKLLQHQKSVQNFHKFSGNH